MNFNDHSSYRDSHALLSASKYHWLNYSDDKMMEYFSKVGIIAKRKNSC